MGVAGVCSMLSLQLVLKMRSAELPFTWATVDQSRDWIVIGPDTTDADVGLVVATLAADNDVPAGAAITEACALLGEASPFCSEGGLIIRRGDFVMEPQCCGELSDWRGWIDLKPGAVTPWMGHGPAGWIHTPQDCAVIYEDGGDTNSPLEASGGVAAIAVPYSEVAAAVATVAEAVVGFQKRLDDWIARHAPENTMLAIRFAEVFGVPA